MADQQDLRPIVTAQAAQLDRYEAAQAHSIVASGIASAIRETGVPLRPGALEQLVEVLRPSVTLAGGRVAGPSAIPIGEFVRQTLAQPTFSHFRIEDTAPDPSAKELLPGENLGVAALRCFAAGQAASQAKAAATDPRTDLSVPFGIRPRARPPI
jgi:hypothetical protein